MTESNTADKDKDKNTVAKNTVAINTSVADPDPYWIRIRWAADSGYGSAFGMRIRIQMFSFLPDIFYKKSNLLTKIHSFKLKLLSYEKRTIFLSVKDGLYGF